MKRKKMTAQDLYAADISFYDFHRVKNADGLRGFRYILDKPLTEEQLAVVKQFKNVILGGAQHKYAPEIRHQTIILTDKCLPAA